MANSVKYVFTNWSGDLSGATNPADVQLLADATIVANYSLVTHKLTYNSTPVAVQITVKVGANSPVPLNPGQSIDVPEGEAIVVTAPSEVTI